MLLTERSARRLAVIVHADVVSSTTLVQQGETFAHDRLQDPFHRFSGSISTYGGDAHEIRGSAGCSGRHTTMPAPTPGEWLNAFEH
jgi:hypothetical protein